MKKYLYILGAIALILIGASIVFKLTLLLFKVAFTVLVIGGLLFYIKKGLDSKEQSEKEYIEEHGDDHVDEHGLSFDPNKKVKTGQEVIDELKKSMGDK